MNEEEEQKDFWYPKNDSRIIYFARLSTEEQLQAIHIGTIMRDVGIDEVKRMVAGKHDQDIQQNRKKHKDEIDKFRSQLIGLREEKEELAGLVGEKAIFDEKVQIIMGYIGGGCIENAASDIAIETLINGGNYNKIFSYKVEKVKTYLMKKEYPIIL